MSQLSELSAHERMIRQQIIDRGIRDPLVIDAMRRVPRERFFLPDARDSAFADRASPIGHGQTISQPYMVALMSERLDIEPQNRVLEIGTGSGYHTAVLARLGKQIFTVERLKPLLDEAWEKLMALDIRNVQFRFGDGSLGWPEQAPFDRILIGAGAPRIPETLLKTQLVDGGIAVLPVGESEEQILVEVRRQGNRLETTEICLCRFVRLIGQEGWASDDDAQSP
ncbi:MAG: protein-L-isoaspartate(D-aspartate) O-methyltransferase [Tepidisphaeraceae bacterium]|jgi:protein-L-isoaspartate(D-aspartate) O-methyltransferase